MSIKRQCEFLGLPRSSYYYEPDEETEQYLTLMRLIDKLHLKYPFYGVKRMRTALSTEALPLNEKSIRKLMRMMGIESFYPSIFRITCADSRKGNKGGFAVFIEISRIWKLDRLIFPDKKTTIMTSLEEIKKHLIFLLEKAEIYSDEMRWLLNYLEQTDNHELCEILYKRFRQDFASSDMILEPEQKKLLNRIRKRLYKQLFDES